MRLYKVATDAQRPIPDTRSQVFLYRRIRLARARLSLKRARARTLGIHLGEVFVGRDNGLSSYGFVLVVPTGTAHRLDLSLNTLGIGQRREPPCSTYTL